MKKTNLVLLTIAAVFLGLGIYTAVAYSFPPYSFTTKTNPGTYFVGATDSSTAGPLGFGPRMNDGSGWPWSCPYYSVQTISIDDAISAMHSPPGYAKIFSNNNTIVFDGSQQNITILALSMGGDRARNLTGLQLPGYSSDNVFVIDGLINPTLVLPHGANVRIVTVNLDEDAYHNFVMTSVAPPYSYMPMQGMMWSNSTYYYGSGMMGGGYGGMMGGGNYGSIYAVMMPMLSPANYNGGLANFYAESFILNNPPGTYWYVCTYPGHAQMGMYGRIVVTA